MNLGKWMTVFLFTISGALWSAVQSGEATTNSVAVKILALTNEARKQQGLKPLLLDAALCQVAQRHCSEMDALGYFGHRSPTPGSQSLTERYHRQGLFCLTSAENLGRLEGYPESEVAKHVVGDWLSSSSHRKNLLSSKYSHVGIACAQVGDRYTVTQDFAFLPMRLLASEVARSGSTIKLSMHCRILEGAKAGAVFCSGKKLAEWTADELGDFAVSVSVSREDTLSFAQRSPDGGFAIETEVPTRLLPSGRSAAGDPSDQGPRYPFDP